MNILKKQKLAIDGGTPIRTAPFPSWPIYGDLEKKLLLEVLDSGKWGGAGMPFSPEIEAKIPEFEAKFSRLQQARHAVTVANGTVAITVALRALGVEPGDEVIVPPYTFIGTVSAALAYGVIPVFVDIEEETLLIDPAKVEAAITPQTRAIVAVHLGGLPCDLARLKEIADRRGLALLEDSAQAVGAQWDGRGVGAIGAAGTFSFQSSKNLCAGEGGAILTDDAEVAETCWSLANCGRVRQGEWYQHSRMGQNHRMAEFQAAILLAQMTRLEEQLALREQNAAILDDDLSRIPGLRLLRRDPRVTRHGWHLYAFTFEREFAEKFEKAEFVRRVNAEGIPLGVGYSESLNRNRAVIESVYRLRGEERVDSCPVSEWVTDKGTVRFGQTVLLADEAAMHDIARGLEKVVASYA